MDSRGNLHSLEGMNEDGQKAFFKKLNAEGLAAVPIDLEDATEKQRKNMKVSRYDFTSPLGKTLAAMNRNQRKRARKNLKANKPR